MKHPIMPSHVLLLTLLASSAASARALEPDLPLPPAPPELTGFVESAPMPDRDAAAPLAPASETLGFNVKMYRNNTYDPSLGFTPGSRYQSTEDRKAIQTPGLSFSVPLQ